MEVNALRGKSRGTRKGKDKGQRQWQRTPPNVAVVIILKQSLAVGISAKTLRVTAQLDTVQHIPRTTS